MKTVRVAGTELKYVERGSGLPLLLVHGFPLDHTMWTDQVEALSGQYRVIAPDLRGLGQSPPQGDVVTMEQFAHDLAGLLDGLGIEGPVVYCGLSMGGYVGFQFWRKYAARLQGLVLCDTRAVADTAEAAAARREMADRVVGEGPAPLVETMMPKLFGQATRRDRPEVVERLRRVMMAGSPQGIAAAARGMAERPDVNGLLPKIACPTLVVVGVEDAISPPAEMQPMAAAIAGAQYVEIPASGHMSPMENPEAVSGAIARFLRAI